MTLQIEDAGNDVAKQLDQINNFVASGVDAIIVNPVDTQNAGIRVFYDVGQPVPLKAESNRTNVSYSWSVLIGSGTVTPVGNGATASYQPNATCNEKVELQVTMTDLDTNEQVTTFVTFFAESSSAGCVK